jgi:MOSC domain-containing protein YiiM
MGGSVLALFAGGPGFVKEPRDAVTIDEGGALGDRHHGRSAERALLLVPAASYRALAGDGLPVRYGSLGENLVASGLPAEGLTPGAHLALGEVRAVVEAPCTVCRALAEVHPRLPKLAYGRRGVYLRVLQGGALRAGDSVRIVSGMTSPARDVPAAAPRAQAAPTYDPVILEEASR